ncbi:Spy/CpxP family protein refolding chaperone [Paramagnetospirillum kuznetsovii]|nr:Spy/CpxP family protein refolding chaperone [Paramagnetospirillum kuznetsovii]
MKSFPRYTIALAVVLAVAGAAGIARASGPMGGGPEGMGRMCSDMDARMAGKAAYMETKLGLTEAQKHDFKALNDAMKASQEPMKKLCAEMASQPQATTPPTRMAQMQKMMEARSANMATIIPAMTKFYDGLTPEQKKIADSTMMGGQGHGHGPMGH